MTAAPEHAVRSLKRARGGGVWLIERPGQQRRTLKRWTLTPWLACKLGMGIAQPQRQVSGARRLARAGLRTPGVLGGWRLRWRGRPVVEVELEWVEGRSALELARQASPGGLDPGTISAEVGRTVAAMAGAGLFNRDVKLENLVVDEAGGVWQIDPVGVRLARRRVRETARMLERLGVQLDQMGDRISRPVWVPAVRAALRPLSRAKRRAAVRWLQERRRRQSS